VQQAEREGTRAPRQQYKSAAGGGGGGVTLWRGAGGESEGDWRGGGATGAREVSAAAFASAAIRGGGRGDGQTKENGSGGSGMSKFEVLQMEGQDGSQQSAARIQKESTRESNMEADASPLQVCKAESS
jgi:hypothetical protein